MCGCVSPLNIPCEYPFIINDGVDGDGEIFIDIDSGIFQVVEVWNVYVFGNCGNTIFSLVVGKKCVVITCD